MFDDEAAIRSWRRTLLASGTLRAADVDELEDHLRQEIERLSVLALPGGSALSSEEVFVLATRRLGRTEALAEEFAKSDPSAVWRRRWIWLLCGYIAVGFAVRLVLTGGMFAYMAASGAGAGDAVRLGAYSAAVVLGGAGIVVLARAIARRTSTFRLPNMLERGLGTSAGIVVLTILAMAATALVSPVASGLVVAHYESAPAARVLVEYAYAQVALWIVPFVVLAALIRLERRGAGRSTA